MTGTVLVVEDDEPTATLIRDVLEAQGYTVLHAIDGASLAVASREHPDAILLDINMPDMSGPEVSQRLRADPTTAQIPIIAMSSHVAPGTIPPTMRHDDTLAKPFALADLYAVVARWVT